MKRILVLFSILWSGYGFCYPLADIYKNLDITTFESSLMPKRSGNETRFSELKFLPEPRIEDSTIIIENDSWLYAVQVIKEDKYGIHICFYDHAYKGNYDAQYPILIRKYAERYVALYLKSNVCKEIVH